MPAAFQLPARENLGKTTEERTPQVGVELEGLDRVTRNISDVLNRLEDKIVPILREAQPATPEPAKNCEEIKRVPLAAEINGIYWMLDTICDRLEDILDRVEV